MTTHINYIYNNLCFVHLQDIRGVPEMYVPASHPRAELFHPLTVR